MSNSSQYVEDYFLPTLTPEERDELHRLAPWNQPGYDEPRVTYHGAPLCRCGSRNSKALGQSALLRQCQECGKTYAYRLKDGLLIPYDPAVAVLLEEAKWTR